MAAAPSLINPSTAVSSWSGRRSVVHTIRHPSLSRSELDQFDARLVMLEGQSAFDDGVHEPMPSGIGTHQPLGRHRAGGKRDDSVPADDRASTTKPGTRRSWSAPKSRRAFHTSAVLDLTSTVSVIDPMGTFSCLPSGRVKRTRFEPRISGASTQAAGITQGTDRVPVQTGLEQDLLGVLTQCGCRPGRGRRVTGEMDRRRHDAVIRAVVRPHEGKKPVDLDLGMGVQFRGAKHRCPDTAEPGELLLDLVQGEWMKTASSSRISSSGSRSAPPGRRSARR